MDEKVRSAIDLSDTGPQKLECPDCGEIYETSHICKEGIAHEIALTRASFTAAIVALAKIRNATLVWQKGKETEKIKEVASIARNALKDIREYIGKTTEDLDAIAAVNSGKPGGISPVASDSV